MGTLTVRENLMFSASLRLPSTISKRDKRRKVEDTLSELGLGDCADSKVKLLLNVTSREKKLRLGDCVHSKVK